CQYNLILQMTSTYETGSANLNYGACGNNNDGAGYSFGMVQFTTASTGYDVAAEYDSLYQNQYGYGSKMGQYLGALKNSKSSGRWGSSGWGNTDGLDGFCDAVKSLKDDPLWQKAQDDVEFKGYFEKINVMADWYGLTSPLLKGQLFDYNIQLGDAVSLFKKVISNNGGDPNSHSHGFADEGAALQAFLWARLKKYDEMGGAFPGTAYRVKSYQHALDAGYLYFQDSIEYLDNGGGKKTIWASC
ncbi:hypothetical protein HK101_004678, partial [Irineochytrium annulatum]